jgi:hypothetical protein
LKKYPIITSQLHKVGAKSQHTFFQKKKMKKEPTYVWFGSVEKGSTQISQ